MEAANQSSSSAPAAAALSPAHGAPAAATIASSPGSGQPAAKRQRRTSGNEWLRSW